MDSLESDSAPPLVQCPSCRSSLEVHRRVEGLEETCPVCERGVRLTVFPRLYREPVEEARPPSVDGEAPSCVFHPELPAEKACDECGSFLSSRAAVRWAGLDLCLPCLHRLREEKRDVHFVARARLDDNLAFALVTWLAPFTLVTAPLALVLLLRSRGAPGGFVPRGRTRWWIAMILAVGWTLAWAAVIVACSALLLANLQ